MLTGTPVRADVAMTGEVTLRGRVLPIGGLKEKVLAAYRFGMKTVVLPKDNEKDLSEIPDDISRQLSFKLVSSMDEVLEIALAGPVSAVELRSESTEEIAAPTEDGPVTTRHREDRFRPFRPLGLPAEDEPKDPGPDIAFRRSNVGKSSLINRLLGSRGLARTSSTPGRTQSANFYRVNEALWFVDLPGYGFAKAPAAVRQTWRG